MFFCVLSVGFNYKIQWVVMAVPGNGLSGL